MDASLVLNQGPVLKARCRIADASIRTGCRATAKGGYGRRGLRAVLIHVKRGACCDNMSQVSCFTCGLAQA
jgi:hypothetical protein